MATTLPVPPVWYTPAKGSQLLAVVRNVDGDTWECGFIVPVTIRVNGIDAPEIKTAAGKVSAAFAAGLIKPPTVLLATLAGRDKYGRLVADLILPSGEKLSEVMIAAGQAKAWDGHGPHPKKN